jgi:UDP-hydrolysing UDP-N-acetyl-D-glucosamine 2-epimerase
VANRALIDVVVTARADLSYTLPIAAAIAAHPELRARLTVAGDLDDPRLAVPIPLLRVPAPGLGVDIESSGRGVGELVAGFSKLWANDPPALVLVPCDRFEVLGPATAAVILNLPIAHLYGGEEDVSYSIDTRIRNALSKLAHVHFVMHEATKRRLVKMGEEEWRILVCGASSVACIEPNPAFFLAHARAKEWGEGPFIAATYLPVTTFRERCLLELDAIIAALRDFRSYTIVWNSVNLDPGSDEIARRLHQLSRQERNHVFVENLGAELYFSLLSCASAMVGNSSSGLLEALSFGLPVVNVGVRQTGRLGGDNVLFVPGEVGAIRRALKRALTDKGFRRRVAATPNPFARADAPQVVSTGIAEMLRRPAAQFLIKRSVTNNPRRYAGIKRSIEFSPLAPGTWR